MLAQVFALGNPYKIQGITGSAAYYFLTHHAF